METTGNLAQAQAGIAEIGRRWWILVTGILWLLAAMIILGFDATSLAAIGVPLSVVNLSVGANEFMIAVPRIHRTSEIYGGSASRSVSSCGRT